jgi:chaperonin GroEL
MFLTAARKIRSAAARSTAFVAAAGSRRGFAKEIKFGTEGRAAMLRGVDLLADAVQVSFLRK